MGANAFYLLKRVLWSTHDPWMLKASLGDLVVPTGWR